MGRRWEKREEWRTTRWFIESSGTASGSLVVEGDARDKHANSASGALSVDDRGM